MASTTPRSVKSHSDDKNKDEWTTVRRKGRRGHGPPPPPQSPGSDPSAPFTIAAVRKRKPPRPAGRGLDQIRDDHHRITQKWKSEDQCRRIGEIMASAPARPTISEALCLGLGTFDPDDGSWEARRRAHEQLAAFLLIVEHVQSRQHRPIRCIHQEPSFSRADRGFLESLGHEVVDTPDGFDLVTPDSLVYGIHMYRPVYDAAIAKHIPAIFVGTYYEVWDDIETPLHWPRMEELDEACDKVMFPSDDNYTFTSAAFHWRRQHGT